jgi:hypothetical protein
MQAMHKLLVVSFACGAFMAASAAAGRNGAAPGDSRTLLERALQQPSDSREARPTGQCIIACDDRMVPLKRCADDDCPQFDCKTGVTNCGAR